MDPCSRVAGQFKLISIFPFVGVFCRLVHFLYNNVDLNVWVQYMYVIYARMSCSKNEKLFKTKPLTSQYCKKKKTLGMDEVAFDAKVGRFAFCGCALG